jgi:hypothetical protein
LLLCITVAFSWKLVLSRQYTWLDEGDNLNQVAPWLQAQAAQWHTGHFPLWDPHQQTGIPFVGQVQPGTLNPLNWILFSLPLSDGFIQFRTLNWYWVLIQFIFCAATFACRQPRPFWAGARSAWADSWALSTGRKK